MNSPPRERGTGENEISNPQFPVGSLFVLLELIKRRTWLFLITPTVTGILCATFTFLLPDTYRAQVVLAPSSPFGEKEIATNLESFGAIDHLSGVNFFTPDKERLPSALKVLVSKKFIYAFVQKYGISDSVLLQNGTFFSLCRFALSRIERIAYYMGGGFEVLSGCHFDDEDVYSVLMSKMSVYHDKRSGLVWLRLEHHSPAEASDWLTWLVHELNECLRQRSINETKTVISRIRDLQKSDSLIHHRSLLASLREIQERKLTYLAASTDFVVEVLDSAAAADVPVGPRRSIIVFVGLVFGLFLSMSVLVAGHFIFRTNTESA